MLRQYVSKGGLNYFKGLTEQCDKCYDRGEHVLWVHLTQNLRKR